VQAVNAMHFLEVVTEGFLHITTIYDKDEARGAYPAVHSRHFGLLGQPIVTQFQGFARPRGEQPAFETRGLTEHYHSAGFPVAH